MKQKLVACGSLSALCAGIWLSGCASPHAVQTLADQFHVEAGQDAASFASHFPVVRNGREEDAMRLIAPVAIQTSLSGLSGEFTLKMLAAPVFNLGDGFQMDVLVGGAGNRTQIYTRYFDAGRKAADRVWIPLEIPFELRGLADAYLEIRVSGGPQGDLVADWLALAEVHLAQNSP
jgi:hypothetical protein